MVATVLHGQALMLRSIPALAPPQTATTNDRPTVGGDLRYFQALGDTQGLWADDTSSSTAVSWMPAHVSDFKRGQTSAHTELPTKFVEQITALLDAVDFVLRGHDKK